MAPVGVVADDRARDLVARSRQLREAAGISLAKMAGEVGCSKPTISVWERNPGIEIGRLPGSRDRARKWLAILAVLDATGKPGPG
jgi:transcriptional regulator with XRE-family HTH domain